MRRRAFTASALATALASPAIAQAQWPAKPLRLVIPYPPGGPSDVSSRIVMERAAQLLGQGVLFDNKAGASGMIGAEFVKNQPVDHHTFLTTTTAMVCITRHLQAIPFDPDRDIVPVSRMSTSWGAFAVHPAVPANTVAEFVAYAKANPGKLNYGSAGLANEGIDFSHHSIGSRLRTASATRCAAQIVDDDSSASLGQFQSVRSTEPSTGSSYDDHLVVELQWCHPSTVDTGQPESSRQC